MVGAGLEEELDAAQQCLHADIEVSRLSVKQEFRIASSERISNSVPLRLWSFFDACSERRALAQLGLLLGRRRHSGRCLVHARLLLRRSRARIEGDGQLLWLRGSSHSG